jgi:rhamnose utilization protein RhaD (predicted bifunctional aldolase and dehydrogenase)
MSVLEDKRRELIGLSHDLGAEHRHLAILGEGNTSAKLGDETFIVKASGSSLGTLGDADVVECRFAPLLALMQKTEAGGEEIEGVLFGARVELQAKKPSIEALFHAWLLSLPDVGFVGHTHPVAVNAILCSPLAEQFAQRRIFPDEIVCCGTSSVFVPYIDPGLKLSQSIAQETTRWMASNGATPRVIVLQSHGIITLGASVAAVKAAMFMAVKAAHIFVGSVVLGGPVFLTDEQIASIAGRPDEHYRQRALNL